MKMTSIFQKILGRRSTHNAIFYHLNKDTIKIITYKKTPRDGRWKRGVLCGTDAHDLAFQFCWTLIKDR